MPLPPGFEGYSALYLLAVFSLLLTLLLALEWLWRVAWSFFDAPRPLKHPQTVVRLVLLFLLLQLLVRLAPATWLLMRWPVLPTPERIALGVQVLRFDSLSFVLMAMAWLTARLGDPIINYHLEKQLVSVNLWPTKRQLRRPCYIMLGAFAVAFALTYLR